MGRELRRIKFRAWDKWKKVMHTNPSNGKIRGMNDIFANTGVWVYMQFTEKRDENGTEIFEGDIVKASSDHKINIERGTVIPQRSFEIGEIIYNPEDSRYEVLVREQLEARYDGETPYPRPLRYHPWIVIGNIYENPELLSKEGNNKDETNGNRED